jgi:hypothetical protein
MPIRPFLDGKTFEPDSINTVSRVLEDVCEALDLRLIVDDLATKGAGSVSCSAHRSQ